MTEFPVVELPIGRPDRSRPFDPPAELARIRELRPIAPMTYPDGHDGWLTTGHEESRAVLSHPDFTSRYELLHVPLPGVSQLPAAPVGELGATDPPEHTRYRKLLTRWFTARRMRQLTERVAEFTERHLDAMAKQGPPVDLMRAYARPIPALVICELLGVPYDERESFQQTFDAMVGRDTATPEEQQAAWGRMVSYLGELVTAKRKEPAEDILSDLIGSDLSDEELLGIGTFLLGAGLLTTAGAIGMDVVALLANPEQLAILRADPGLADGAVEELLRYVGVGPFSLRAALADVEIAGCSIKAGQTVTISLEAANRDPRRFTDPDTLDLRRAATGHITFLHGIHQCLGQHLARTELRVAVPALVTRFPSLRLDIPADQVPIRFDQTLYTVDRLPVAWDG